MIWNEMKHSILSQHEREKIVGGGIFKKQLDRHKNFVNTAKQIAKLPYNFPKLLQITLCTLTFLFSGFFVFMDFFLFSYKHLYRIDANLKITIQGNLTIYCNIDLTFILSFSSKFLFQN